MAWHKVLLTASVLVSTSATPVERSPSTHFASRRPAAFAPSAPLQVSTTYAVLQRTGGIASSSRYLLRSVRANSPTNTPLIATDGGTGYAINVAFGNTTLQLILDTGSSDTWAAGTNLTCVDIDQTVVATAECSFGPLYTGGFESGAIENQNLNITYGDGEFITGDLGFVELGFAGKVVKKQEVGVVDYAYWYGDNQTSGLIGLAYPSITAAYAGDDPAQDTRASNVPYDPVVTSAGKQGLFTSFSLAIERGGNGGGGFLALGGLPPVDFKHVFASTPIEITTAAAAVVGGAVLSYYSITPEGFVLGTGKKGARARTYGSGFSVIVDSGTTLIYLPPSLALAVNSLFQPPARYVASAGLFEVPCNARAPTFGVRINGTNFFVSGQDLLLPREQGYDSETGLCATGVQVAYGRPAILGDVFLRNVVAVFDVGAGEMRFAAHVDY